MYKLLASTLLLIPFATSAQNPGATQMDEAQMQQAQRMQDCMANIDQAEMEAFQQQSEEMDSEVKALCAAGKRDAAEARAMAFGKEAIHSNVMQQMKKCGEGMKNMMPNQPKTAHPHEDDNSAPRHICDE